MNGNVAPAMVVTVEARCFGSSSPVVAPPARTRSHTLSTSTPLQMLDDTPPFYDSIKSRAFAISPSLVEDELLFQTLVLAVAGHRKHVVVRTAEEHVSSVLKLTVNVSVNTPYHNPFASFEALKAARKERPIVDKRIALISISGSDCPLQIATVVVVMQQHPSRFVSSYVYIA